MEVISGLISKSSVESVFLNILDDPGDQSAMGAAGGLMAAMGLSGPAAGLATISADVVNEAVSKVVFKLGDVRCTALLAAWPFQEGDEIKVVGAAGGKDSFVAVAALDERKRVIVLYPHVSAGGCAHWMSVLRYSLYVGAPFALVAVICACIADYGHGNSPDGLLWFMVLFFLLCLSMMLFVGYRIGRRFKRFVRIAEAVFTALEWKDVRWINLRIDVTARRRPEDPPQLGDTYFRY